MEYEQLAMCYAAAMARLAAIKATVESSDLDNDVACCAVQAIVKLPLMVPCLNELRRVPGKAVAS